MEDECCKPGLADAQYPRGPSDINPAMFPFERKMAEAIEARYGKPTALTTQLPNTSKLSGPGDS